MVRRYGLTDTQWAVLEPLLPPRSKEGRPRKDDRQVVEGILWRLRTGAPWRDLPARFGPHQTVSGRYHRWAKAGVWTRVLQALNGMLQAEGQLDETWYIDATSIRATRAAAGAGKKGARTSRPTTDWGEAAVG